MMMKLALPAVLGLFVAAGCGSDDTPTGSGDEPHPGRLSVFERPYSERSDRFDDRTIFSSVRVGASNVRHARTIEGVDYFIAKGKMGGHPWLCLLEDRGGLDLSSACRPRGTLLDDVIWLTSVGEEQGYVAGIAADDVVELSIGSVSAEPESNVFVLPDVPVDEAELQIRFTDGREKTRPINSS